MKLTLNVCLGDEAVIAGRPEPWLRAQAAPSRDFRAASPGGEYVD